MFVIEQGEVFHWQWPDGTALTWSIGKAKEIVKGRQPLLAATLQQIRGALSMNGDKTICESHAMTRDLAEPIIVIQSPWQSYEIASDNSSIACKYCNRVSHNPSDVQHRYCGNCHEFHDRTHLLIIDGWHRMKKADLTNHPELKAHLLTPDEELACRVMPLNFTTDGQQPSVPSSLPRENG